MKTTENVDCILAGITALFLLISTVTEAILWTPDRHVRSEPPYSLIDRNCPATRFTHAYHFDANGQYRCMVDVNRAIRAWPDHDKFASIALKNERKFAKK
jgi:hypothetical protein